MFRVSRPKEKQTRHTKFSHNVPELIVLRKSHGHTLAMPLDSLKRGPDIPGKRTTSFPDDVQSSNPAVAESRSKQTSTELIGHNLGFG